MDAGSAVSAPRRDGATKGTALAPWQHLRSTLDRPRDRLGFPTVFLSILLGATLALSACGAQEAGAAAIVNGTAISEHDVQIVADQINALALGGQKISPSEVLYILILAPYVRDEAKRTSKTVSASEARKAVAKVADPAPATIEFVQMQIAGQRLDEASATSILSKLRVAKITINPRYGTFDAVKVVITATSPNWMKASAASPAK
jgi:hypothetical protein